MFEELKNSFGRVTRRPSGGGGQIHILRKRRVSGKRPFSLKIPLKGLEGPKMSYFRIRIPCPALKMKYPRWDLKDALLFTRDKIDLSLDNNSFEGTL